MPKSVKPIKGLSPDKANANRMTVRGRGRVAYSLGRYGAGRCVVVDEDGNVIAANKTLEAAEALGLPVKVVQTDGTTRIVHQRADLDLYGDPIARQLAYADNRTSEAGIEWDAEQIARDVADGVEVDLFIQRRRAGRHPDKEEAAARLKSPLPQVGRVGPGWGQRRCQTPWSNIFERWPTGTLQR